MRMLNVRCRALDAERSFVIELGLSLSHRTGDPMYTVDHTDAAPTELGCTLEKFNSIQFNEI